MSLNGTFTDFTVMYNDSHYKDDGEDGICEEIYLSKQKYVANIFVVVSASFAIVFNFLVLVIAFKYVKFKKRNEQWFVVNIAMSDFILGLIYLTTMRNAEQLPWYLCRPYYAAIWTTSVGSTMFLFLLNLHKLATLMFPIQSMVCITKNKILLEIILCWTIISIMSIVFSMKPFLNVYENECYQCYVQIEYDYYSLRLILLFILPLTVSLAISVCIFVVAQKNSRRSKTWFKRILFVFSSTIWTASTSLPYRIAYLTTTICFSLLLKSMRNSFQIDNNHFNNNTSIPSLMEYTVTYSNYSNIDEESAADNFDRASCINETVQYAFMCWLSLGSVINPLITIFTQSNYRNGVRNMWKMVTKAKGYMSPRKAHSNNTISCSLL